MKTNITTIAVIIAIAALYYASDQRDKYVSSKAVNKMFVGELLKFEPSDSIIAHLAPEDEDSETVEPEFPFQ